MSFESLPSSISERKHIDIKPEQEYNSSPFKQSPPCIEVSDHTEDLVQKKFPKDDYDEQYKRRFEPQPKPQIVERSSEQQSSSQPLSITSIYSVDYLRHKFLRNILKRKCEKDM